MIKQFRWVKQGVASAPGDGDIALGGRESGYLALSDISDVVDGTQIYYTVEDGQDREYGVGTYVSATNSLVRTSVHAIMRSGKILRYPINGLNLTGNALVLSEPQAKPFRGLLIGLSSNFTLTYNAWTQIPWSSVKYDTDDFFVSPNIVIPNGVNFIRTHVGLEVDYGNTGLNFYVAVNGSTARGAIRAGSQPSTSALSASGPAIPVTTGDVITTHINPNNYSSRYLIGSSAANFFSLEVVG